MTSLVERATALLSGRRSRNAARVLSANIANNLVSFAVSLVVARQLGPTGFGPFAFAVAVTVLLSGALDFGTSIAAVRFYNRSTNRDEAERSLTAALQFKLLVAFACALLAYPCALGVVRVFPVVEGSVALIVLAIVSGGLLSLWTTLRACEQARRDFTRVQRMTLAYALLRAIAGGIAAGFGMPVVAFAALYAGPLLALTAFSLARHFAGALSFRGISAQRELVLRLLTYGVWVMVSALAFTLLQRVPQLALARWGTGFDLGIFGAALTFLAVFSMLNDTVRTVLVPEVSALSTSEHRAAYRSMVRRFGPLYFAAMTGCLAACAVAQWWLLGSAYRSGLPVFVVLGAATVITMYLGLFNTLVHSVGKPHLDAVVNIGRVCLLAAALAACSHGLSAMIAAGTFGAVLVIGEAALSWLLRKA